MMVSFDEAQERLRVLGAASRVEKIALGEARGRFIAEDFFAPFDQPPFAQSAVDGYAIRAEAFDGANGNSSETRFSLVGETHAGDRVASRIGRGECAYVATGAPVPEGAGRVIMKEAVSAEKNRVGALPPKSPKTHIREKGETAREGERLIEKGRLLNAASAGIFASFGEKEVTVFRRPKIAILTTGNEIQEPGRALETGRIYNSNAAILKALADKPWLHPLPHRHAPDDPEALAENIRLLGGEADFLLITGGVSVGKKDYAKTALRRAGFDFLFEKAALRPGKPFSAATSTGPDGRRRGAFAFPGNPPAVFSICVALILPFLFRHASGGISGIPFKKGILAAEVPKPPGGTLLLPARVEYSESGAAAIHPVPKSDAGGIFSFLGSSCLCVLHADARGEAGETAIFLENDAWA